ncbi:hypothetical protein RB195_014124 [Necator americanus]|uniref:Aromatic-di-Alanine repeat protein n=2 Tax=Necator americanus TaxID=51031 RepID=A0ABR1DYP9_NECAM
MADSEVKARRKLEEAEKKSRGGGGFLGKLFGGSGADEAADLFIQAGNLFKMAKLWKDAGDAFVRAAEIHGSKSDSKHDCASQYAEAANCYRKVNPQVAVDCLLKTSEIYTDMGRFNMAAKNHVAIAELFESECPDTEQCIQHYQKAADYYKGEEAKSSATKCLIKVAQYAAQLEQYQKAISVFEEIALWEADHPTLKYAAKNHFFQSLLCYLCIDPLDAQHALKRYEDASPSFADTREAKLIKDLIACLEDGNEELFTDTVKAFDKVSRLDQWHTSLLVKIKRAISKEDEEDLKDNSNKDSSYMSDAEIDYWRTKYSLLEEQFKQQKNRNEELEERLLHMVEKIEAEKKQLAEEIHTLTRKLEHLTSKGTCTENGDTNESYEPEDPSIPRIDVQLSRTSKQKVILGSRSMDSSHETKGCHHFPVLAFEEGLIYGFRWVKGSVVKIV